MSKLIRYPLIFIYCSLSVLQLSAQRPQGEKAADVIFEILPIAQKGYVSVFTDNPEAPTKVRFTLTDAAGQLQSEQELSLVRRGLAGMLESAFIWEGQLTLVTSLFYPGPQRDLLFVRRYSLPDLEEMAAEKIAEAYVPGRLRIPFGYALSPDSTRIMFYSWTYAVPEDPVKMEIHVLDRQLTRIWDKRFLLPNKNANFYIYACKVDNAGNAFLLCEDYKGKVGSRIQDEKIERFVLRLDQNSSEATSYKIELTDKVITDLSFVMDKKGNLYGGGIYREGRGIYQDGVFAYRIDQQTQGFQKREIPIDKDDYQAMHAYTDDQGRYVSGTRQFRNYALDQVIWDEQDGLTLVGEQRIFEGDEDQYNDILMVQLDTSLRKKWGTRIPKAQATPWGGSEFASYTYLRRDGKNYLLFNDHMDNMPTESDVPNRIKGLNFTIGMPKPLLHIVQVQPDGTLRHQNLNEVVESGSRLGLVPALTCSDRQNVFLLYVKDVIDSSAKGLVFPISWKKD